MDQLRDGSMNLPASTKRVIGASLIDALCYPHTVIPRASRGWI